MSSRGSAWRVTFIACDSWAHQGDRAYAEFSSIDGDAYSLEMTLNTKGEAVVSSFQMITASKMSFDRSTQGILEIVIPLIKAQLSNWNYAVHKIVGLLPKGKWKKGPGISIDYEYAILAYLCEKLSEFGGLKTTIRISQLLEIEPTTAKERIKECRKRDFLTAPSKGVRGSSKMTQKAKKLLRTKGVIDAKKNK